MTMNQDWKHYARNTSEYLRWGEKALQTLANMRLSGGSPISIALSGMSLAAQAIDALVPPPDVVKYVVETLGYSTTPWNLLFDRMVVAWLATHTTTERVERKLWKTTKLVEFPEFGLAMTVGGRLIPPGPGETDVDMASTNLFVKAGDDLAARISKLVDQKFWSGGDQEVSTRYANDHVREAQFRPLPEPIPAYLGDPSPESIVADLPHGKSHTIFFYGPSGSGKSSLARQVARLVNPKGRMLRFSTRSFGMWDMTLLRQMLTLLRPNVLLIDDIQSYLDDSGVDILIEQLEGMSQVASENNVLILGTIMTEEEAIPGREGLRPGRVDRWVHLRRPNAAWRHKILSMYLGGAEPPGHMVEFTEGLTGAFLSQVAERHKIRPDLWRHAVASMRSIAVSTPANSSTHINLDRFLHNRQNERRTLQQPNPEEKLRRELLKSDLVRGLTRAVTQEFITKKQIPTNRVRDAILALIDEINETVDKAPADMSTETAMEKMNQLKPLRPTKSTDGQTRPDAAPDAPRLKYQDEHVDIVLEHILTSTLGPGWKEDPQALAFLV